MFKSYLSCRKKIVVVDGVKSQVENIKSGIPKRIKTWTHLVILYIKDIKEGLKSQLFIFADNTTLIATGPDPEITSGQLNRNLKKIETLATTWKVTFNSDKTKGMVFSKKVIFKSTLVIFNQFQVDRVTLHRPQNKP